MNTKLEGFQWILTLLNTLQNGVDFLSKTHEKIPEVWKQKLPGFLGLSLADEQIFNGILGQLSADKQILINKFLYEKCKDYERNRFINIVAGMEVIPGKGEEKETRWSEKTGAVVFEKTKDGTPGVDCRKDFLVKFADIIKEQNDLQKSYEFCIGGRMIIPDPMSQKVLRGFSESVGSFKKFVMAPLGANSIEELIQKAGQKLSENSSDIGNKTQTFRERARAFRQKQAGGR